MAETEPAAPSALRATAEEAGPVLRVVSVEVPAARVRRAFDHAYRDLGRRANVKGFRPGKVPRSVLERLYGPMLLEDVERALVAETLPEAVEQVGVEPVAEPAIESGPPAADAPFRYTARIEVKPRIELPDLAGLSGQRPAVVAGDADVERELEALRQRRATLADLPSGTPIEDGHFVTLDYVGRVAGKPFDGGSGQGATVQVGSGVFAPGFDEALHGLRAGEDKEIAVALPADSGWGEAAGHDATFAVHIVAVKHRPLPALDDAFARQVGAFESMEALRERVRSEILAAREREARARLRASLLEDALRRVEFPVPPGLAERRLDARLQLAHRELEGAMAHDALHARLDAWREEWRPAVDRELREELLLEAVGAARGLAPDEDAVTARIDELAREQGIDARRLRKSYDERGMRGALAAQILRERALDALIEQAHVIEVPAPEAA
jgi:trigger factor